MPTVQLRRWLTGMRLIILTSGCAYRSIPLPGLILGARKPLRCVVPFNVGYVAVL